MKFFLRVKMLFLIVGVLVAIVFVQAAPSEARTDPSDDDIVCMGDEQYGPSAAYRAYMIIDRPIHFKYKEMFGEGVCSQFDIDGEVLNWVATCEKEKYWCSGNDAYTLEDLYGSDCLERNRDYDYSVKNESGCRDYIETEEKDLVILPS